MLTIQNQTRAGKIFKCTIFVGYGGVIFLLLESHLEENLVFFKTLLFLSNTHFPRPNQAKRANQ